MNVELLYQAAGYDISKGLRQLKDIKFLEVNKIVSILLGRDQSCGVIELVGDDFLTATFKKVEDFTEGRWIEMGITIDGNFKVDYTWNYCTAKGTGVTHEPLHNQHEITMYLLSQGFDILNTIK